MLPHAVFYCFLLPHAALLTYHIVLRETCCLMLSCTTSYFPMLPFPHLTLPLPKLCCPVPLLSALCCLIYIYFTGIQKHAATCCLVLLLTSLCCLTNLKHCPSQKYASLYCFYSPKLSNTNITLTLENMLPHAVLYCFPLSYAALPTFHTVFLINMLPCTASYCPMLPYPYKPLTL